MLWVHSVSVVVGGGSLFMVTAVGLWLDLWHGGSVVVGVSSHGRGSVVGSVAVGPRLWWGLWGGPWLLWGCSHGSMMDLWLLGVSIAVGPWLGFLVGP